MINFISNTIQCHIAYIDENGIDYYLALQRSSKKQPYPNLWQVITGKIENNETAINAAKREVYEETGIIAYEIITIPYMTSFFNSKDNIICFSPVFGIIVYENDIKLSAEHQDFKWLKYNEINNLLELPSHREGTNIFKEYIINKKVLNIK